METTAFLLPSARSAGWGGVGVRGVFVTRDCSPPANACLESLFQCPSGGAFPPYKSYSGAELREDKEPPSQPWQLSKGGTGYVCCCECATGRDCGFQSAL